MTTSFFPSVNAENDDKDDDKDTDIDDDKDDDSRFDADKLEIAKRRDEAFRLQLRDERLPPTSYFRRRLHEERLQFQLQPHFEEGIDELV